MDDKCIDRFFQNGNLRRQEPVVVDVAVLVVVLLVLVLVLVLVLMLVLTVVLLLVDNVSVEVQLDVASKSLDHNSISLYFL